MASTNLTLPHAYLYLQGSWSSVTKSKQSWPQQPHPTTPTQSQPRREKVPSISTDNDEEEGEMSFWDECALEAKNNPAPSSGSRQRGSQKKKTHNKEEVCVFIHIVACVSAWVSVYVVCCLATRI